MTKKILDIGNCGFDHGNLQAVLARHFEAEVTQAHGSADALQLLREGSFDLVLVNRQFDRDGADGIELIRQITSDGETNGPPVMLLSNYPQYQQQAIAAGAVPGFGKAELDSPATMERLRGVLSGGDEII